MTKPAIPTLEQLQTIFPPAKTIEVSGLTIEVPVLSFAKVARIGAIVGPILAKAEGRSIVELVTANGDGLMRILSVALDWPMNVVEALPPDVALAAFLALVEQNSDFLTTQLAPRLAGLQAAGAQLGSTSSESSPSTDTTTLQ
jgi:hypothetical protein